MLISVLPTSLCIATRYFVDVYRFRFLQHLAFKSNTIILPLTYFGLVNQHVIRHHWFQYLLRSLFTLSKDLIVIMMTYIRHISYRFTCMISSTVFPVSFLLSVKEKLLCIYLWFLSRKYIFPCSNVHGASMGPTWVLSAPDGPHVGPMNIVNRVAIRLWNSICLL